MTFAILGLDHVVLRIRNRSRMLHFYCDLLGYSKEQVAAMKEEGVI